MNHAEDAASKMMDSWRQQAIQSALAATPAQPYIEAATITESWHLRIEAAVKAERDRCIKIAEDQGANGHLQSMVSEEYHDGTTDCANVIAIRIREGK